MRGPRRSRQAHPRRDVDAAAVTYAAKRWPRCRSRANPSLLELQRAQRPFGGFAAMRWGAAARAGTRVRIAGPDLRARRAAADYWRLARALFAAGFRAAISSTTPLPTTSRRPARCSKRARTRSAAPCSRAAPARPSSRCRRSPICNPTAMSARRRFSRSSSTRRTSWASRCRASTRRCVSGEAFLPALRDALAARGIAGYQAVRDGRRGRDCLRNDGARRARRRRGRAGRDRASRHRRSGARRARSAKSSSRRCSTRLSADPLRHRRPFDVSPGHEPLRAHQRAHQGLDGPRRPDDQGARDVRAPGAGRGHRRRHPEIVKARLVVDQSGRRGSHDAARRSVGAATRSSLDARRGGDRSRDITKLRGEVAFCARGELPNDGKVIDDVRKSSDLALPVVRHSTA